MLGLACFVNQCSLGCAPMTTGHIGLLVGVVLIVAFLIQMRGHLTRRFAADEILVRGWSCPDCHQEFGAGSTVIFYGGHSEDPVMIDGRLFNSWVLVVCANCKLLRRYNRNGEPWSIPGI